MNRLGSMILLIALLTGSAASGFAADAGRRAADNARPRLEEVQSDVVVIHVKSDNDGLTILAGDGKSMMVKPRQELKLFLKAMRRDGKRQAVVSGDRDLPWNTFLDIVKDAQAAGFEGIILGNLPKNK
jgi:biopolymer transport protein ExbD